MYENMKAKDAAKIFDRLDLKVLVDVSTKINPRRMSDILAPMSPEVAERLTIELASRASRESARRRAHGRIDLDRGKPNSVSGPARDAVRTDRPRRMFNRCKIGISG